MDLNLRSGRSHRHEKGIPGFWACGVCADQQQPLCRRGCNTNGCQRGRHQKGCGQGRLAGLGFSRLSGHHRQHQYPQPQRSSSGGQQIRSVAGPAVLASSQSSENGVTTAENCDLNGQSDYSFSDTDYVFGMADYLRDTLIAASGGALPKSWVTAADC